MVNTFHRYNKTNANHEPIPEGIVRAKNQIELHANQYITLEQLAQTSGYSIPHFCTLFKEILGITPIAYSTQIRMRQAAYLLNDKNKRVTAIAEELGYKDVYHFSKRFKQYFGKSPKNFRKLSDK